MIEVIVERLPDANKAKEMDIYAEAYAIEVRDIVKDKKCKQHPDETSILKIIADKDESIRIDKSGFCCEEFANRIDVRGND